MALEKGWRASGLLLLGARRIPAGPRPRPRPGAQRRVRMESACSWGSWQQLAAECPLRPGPGRVGPEALGVCGLEAGPAASGLEREGRGAGKAGVAARPLRELG